MILPTVHLPAAYQVSTVDTEECQALRCSVCVQMLVDALENCVLLVDNEGNLKTELARAVRAWPIKHRKRVEVLLKRLDSRQRFVEVPRLPVTTNAQPLCARALEIAGREERIWTIVPTRCVCQTNDCSDLASVRAVRVSEYIASDFNQRRRAASRIDHAEARWSREQFEDEVWKPLFTYARFVHLFDRLVGSKATTNGPESNFIRTIEWILTQFLRHSRSKSSERPFAIYTDVPESGLVRQAVDDYALALEKEHGFPVRIFRARVGHDRYLNTNQIRLNVSTGFDLLHKNLPNGSHGNVRAVSLNLFRPFADQ